MTNDPLEAQREAARRVAPPPPPRSRRWHGLLFWLCLLGLFAFFFWYFDRAPR